MLRAVVLISLLAAPFGVRAQQPEAPVRAGSPGVAPLQLATYVRPMYPQIAASARILGEVVLDIVVGEDGNLRAGGVRVVKSVPLLDQAAIDAVRRWRFESPTVRGVPAPVSVSVTVTFQEAGPLSEPVPGIQSESLPRDFVIAFKSNCGGTLEFNSATGIYERTMGPVSVRVGAGMKPTDLEALYDVIVRSGLMADTTVLARWPEVSDEPHISDAGIRVALSVGRPFVVTVTDGPTPPQYLLELRMNGTWTRLFPPASWRNLFTYEPSPREVQMQLAVRQVERFLEKHVQSFDYIRRLPRNQQWCRWPN
jgi:TonB family protein